MVPADSYGPVHTRFPVTTRALADAIGVYAAFGRAGFRRYSAYRAASAAGAATNIVFGIVKAAIMMAAITAAGGAIAGYDANQTVNNAWIGQSLVAVVAMFGWDDLSLRIRSGDIAVDLTRPVDLQLSWLAADLGRAGYLLVPRGLPPILIGIIFFKVTLPRDPAGYLLGMISVVLAVAVSFACRFLVGLVAFWIIELRGVLTLYLVTSNVLCGLVVPVPWFPDWLRVIATVTPFPSILQAPIDVISGRVIGWDVAETVAVQAFWLTITIIIGRLVLARATHKLVVQGG